jgi:DNA-binding XRE family transcriptional regulator
MARYVAGLGALSSVSEFIARKRLTELEARLEACEGKGAGLLERASSKVRAGAQLTRGELAAFHGVSSRTVQRLEASGRLRRCEGYGTLVRYAARDVLQLASAKGKER